MPNSKVIEQRLRFLNFDEEENARALRDLEPIVKAGIDEMLNKAVVLDMSFVIESYIDAKNAKMRDILRRATRFTEDVTGLIEG